MLLYHHPLYYCCSLYLTQFIVVRNIFKNLRNHQRKSILVLKYSKLKTNENVKTITHHRYLEPTLEDLLSLCPFLHLNSTQQFLFSKASKMKFKNAIIPTRSYKIKFCVKIQRSSDKQTQ